MTAGEALGRGTEGLREVGLLERELELDAIDGLVESGVCGDRDALLIAGHPGLGKTRLWEVALERARARELLVVTAAGFELEQDFAFGVAGQLLRGLLGAACGRDRGALAEGAPERVRALLGGAPMLAPAGREEALAVSHGLFSVLAAAAQTRPALVAIDDLHWCDAPSLEFVVYLLNRLRELPVALLLTSRPGEADGGALASIAAHPRVRIDTLAPLGRDAVTEMVGWSLGGEQADALTDVCVEATAGNPFYLHELLLALSDEGEDSAERLRERARALAPDAVTRAVAVRIARLGPEAAAVARAVAILGDDVPLRRAAAIAGLDMADAGAAADLLAAVDVLRTAEPLRFTHALVQTAVERQIPASERAGRHLDAARLLAGEGESVELVAAHLLRGRAEGDPWAVEQLRAAAREACSRGAPAPAVRYLERSLEEAPPSELRAELLAELGSAEAALGLEAADEHLALAATAADSPQRRAQIALARGEALYSRGCFEAAANAHKDGLGELLDAPSGEQERELRDRLKTGLVLSAATVPSLQGEAVRLSAEVTEDIQGGVPNESQRLLLAQATVQAAFSARPSDEVIGLATRAWDEGRLLENETASGASWLLVTAALCLAGDLECSLETAELAAADARARSAPLAFATASYMRVVPQLWQGQVDGALADLELARDARRYGWRQYLRSAAAQYCLCMIEKRDLDRAEAALTEDAPLAPPYDGEDAIRLYALAELRQAQGRHDEAYEAALTAGEVAEAQIPYLGYCPWRSPAAQAALALGERARAGELTRQMLERTDTTQVLHERIRAFRLAGLCEGGETGLAKLRQAVELGTQQPPRLETIHALIALGSALRRSGQRAEARPPLERAVALARHGGATALHELARTELEASGARPRRDALTGPESLTPSERRVAELAAAGATNQQIAHALFVTPKTIEYHLRNVYRKLEIDSRHQLSDALET